MEAISNGKNTLSEITSYLYSKGIIPRQETGLITPYIKTMINIGLIKRIKVFGKERRSFYRNYSPLIDFAYYLNAKYSFFDVNLEDEFIVGAWKNKVGIYAGHFFERLLSEIYGLTPVKILDPEIDIALVKFKKLEVVAEVKWREDIKRDEVKRIERKLGKIRAKKKFIIVPDEANVKSEIEVLTPSTIIDLIKDVL